MNKISFETTREEDKLIGAIVDRAMKAFENAPRCPNCMSLTMDLSATNANGCPLDFAKLLAFDGFNFTHDIVGIMKHINRTTGKLENCFVPRCAK